MAQPVMDDNSTQTDPRHRRLPVKGRAGWQKRGGVAEQLTTQHGNERLTVWQYLRGSQAIFYAAAESAVVSPSRRLTSLTVSAVSSRRNVCVRVLGVCAWRVDGWAVKSTVALCHRCCWARPRLSAANCLSNHRLVRWASSFSCHQLTLFDVVVVVARQFRF